jgi:TetR/AcrR family transcriptional regulator, transcriptional repressor for nem operon
MRVAGLQKGGIYRHFDSRATLTLKAFEYAVGMRERFRRAAEGRATATELLLPLLGVFRDASQEDAVHGGCPIMNLAIKSDDVAMPASS